MSGDGLTWTFRLRPGLKFHDGEPVRAKDAVASINLAGCPATDQGRALAQPPESPTVGTGPFTMANQFGTPHTQALHVIERYRLIDCEAAKEALERRAKENASFVRNDSGVSVLPTRNVGVDLNSKAKHVQLQFTDPADGLGRHAAKQRMDCGEGEPLLREEVHQARLDLVDMKDPTKLLPH